MAVWHTHFEEAAAELELEIEGRTLPDRKAVRQAYSRLAKIHRPDEDPEGFQRIRAAYEAVMEGLEQGVIHPDEEDEQEEDEREEEELHEGAEAHAGNEGDAPAAPPEALLESAPQSGAARQDWIDASDEDLSLQRRARRNAPNATPAAAPSPSPSQSPRAVVLPDWARTLEDDSAALESLRSAVFEALAAQPQDAATLQARTAELLQSPALEQLQHRLDVRNWLVSLAAWHPGSTLAWRARIAAHYGIDQSGLADYRDEGLSQLIQRLEVDGQVEGIEEQAKRLPQSVEGAWLHGVSWWTLIRSYLVSEAHARSELVRQTLENLAPERINAQTQARWQALQGFARPSVTGLVILSVMVMAFMSDGLREALAPGAAFLVAMPATLGVVMALLWAAGGGLRWCRSRSLYRHPFAFNGAELVLGLLLLVCAGLTTLKDMEGLSPLCVGLLALLLPIWILSGSLRVLFLHGPLETFGVVMLVGLCSVPVLLAAGLEDYRWVTYVSGWVLIQAWSPLGALSRTDQGPYLWRGGGGFTLSHALRFYLPISLHLLHAALAIGLNDSGDGIRLLLTASALILLYADALLMGMPENLLAGSSRLFIVFYLLFIGLGMAKGLKTWSPGMGRALLDALMVAWLGLGWWKARSARQADTA